MGGTLLFFTSLRTYNANQHDLSNVLLLGFVSEVLFIFVLSKVLFSALGFSGLP